MFHQLFHLPPAFKGAPERHLIGIADIASGRNALGDTKNSDPGVLEPVSDIDGRGIAVHGGVGGDDDLGDLLLPHPLHQLADAELVRADAVKGGDDAVQHMVAALKPDRALNRHEIPWRLHHAQDMPVAARACADRAQLLLRVVEAPGAEAYLFPRIDDALRELARMIQGAVDQKKGKPRGRLLADTRQPCKTRNQLLNGVLCCHGLTD